MCRQCNSEQNEESSGTIYCAEVLLVLVNFIDAKACTVDHHHECLVETIHRLVLPYEVRFVVTFFQVHQSSVFQQKFAKEDKNKVCSEVGVEDYDLNAEPIMSLSELIASTLQRAAYLRSIKKVNILCVDNSENM